MLNYTFDVTGDPSPDNVIVKFGLSFGAACQVLKILADQNWRAAVQDLDQPSDPCHVKLSKPLVFFTLFGKLNEVDEGSGGKTFEEVPAERCVVLDAPEAS